MKIITLNGQICKWRLACSIFFHAKHNGTCRVQGDGNNKGLRTLFIQLSFVFVSSPTQWKGSDVKLSHVSFEHLLLYWHHHPLQRKVNASPQQVFLISLNII